MNPHRRRDDPAEDRAVTTAVHEPHRLTGHRRTPRGRCPATTGHWEENP